MPWRASVKVGEQMEVYAQERSGSGLNASMTVVNRMPGTAPPRSDVQENCTSGWL
jgi:hypothetical protein